MKNYLKYGFVALFVLAFLSMSVSAIVPGGSGSKLPGLVPPAPPRDISPVDAGASIIIQGGWSIECVAVYRNDRGVIIGNRYIVSSPCGGSQVIRDVAWIEGYRVGTQCWVRGEKLGVGGPFDFRVGYS